MRPWIVAFSDACSCGIKKRFAANPRVLVFSDHPERSSLPDAMLKEKSLARKPVAAKSKDANFSGKEFDPSLLLGLELMLLPDSVDRVSTTDIQAC